MFGGKELLYEHFNFSGSNCYKVVSIFIIKLS